MIQLGPTKAVITSNDVQSYNDKEFVLLMLEVGSEPISARIYLTPKALPMARAQLKRCGFDIDTRDLNELWDNKSALAGRLIDVEIEDFKGRLQAKVLAHPPADSKRLTELTKQLRSAKQTDERPEDEGEIPF